MSTLPGTRNTAMPSTSKLDFRSWSPATASAVSGLGLVVMVVLMTAGYFGAVSPLITPGDATKTAQNISQSGTAYLAGVACIVVVILIDVVVSGAWYALFKGVNRQLSAAAAWLRVAYSVLFAVATGQLAYAYTLLESPGRALHAIELFHTIWLISLGLFGLHLILIGCLELRSAFVPKVFGVLLLISAAGYILDALGVAFVEAFTPMYGQFAIIGETSFIFWLLTKGRKLTLR
ncbi:conserved membrane hypothetical protein [Arthrobacter sp. 9AX]|uniref:DUF4386 domain-containing protein n=1 Tax=Arthrobacter sp. 9AX TaxID=2653131 RepID=UPI0012EEEA8C|nr:DUF4386 domain-containing protein [Arthrobacter sp. 9AX]VXC50984.1 conserved membrane hypothetical protein [Arthrobacter sp. 9AX]